MRQTPGNVRCSRSHRTGQIRVEPRTVRTLSVCLCGNTDTVSCLRSYSRDHPLFLQPSNYFWEKNQSLNQLPYGIQGVGFLLRKFLTLTKSYNVPPEIERLLCKRCIVVGNGFRLKNSLLGEVIDSYDIVIRLNNACVYKHQKDVGKKTTMRFFYPESADFNQRLDNNPDSLMVLVPFKPMDINWMNKMMKGDMWVRFWKRPPRRWKVNPENVRIFNPYFMKFAATKLLILEENWKNKTRVVPTLGLLGITFALHFCDLVHVAGFGYPPVSVNNTESIHYYDRVSLKSMDRTLHNITLEAIAIKQLLQDRLIHNLTYF
uniref:ST3 beta-galactoside alpha-2,3-sialyltransferase 4 n=1 Tax=Leptobrachium leishanense TaxID=445787 RepID=A0A8C5WES8_9ANUR